MPARRNAKMGDGENGGGGGTRKRKHQAAGGTTVQSTLVRDQCALYAISRASGVDDSALRLALARAAAWQRENRVDTKSREEGQLTEAALADGGSLPDPSLGLMTQCLKFLGVHSMHPSTVAVVATGNPDVVWYGRFPCRTC